MKKLAAGCVFASAFLAAVVVLPRAFPQQSNPAKPASEDIPPVRTIADPYPAFNGVAVDATNGLVAMSDPNRKSLLLYDRVRGASQGAAASVPLRQIVGPD